MRIAFLNGPTEKYQVSRDSRWPEKTKSKTLYYPFWLAYATATAKKEGFDVFLLDAEAENISIVNVFEKLRAFGPELLVVNTTTPTFEKDLKNVEFLKKLGAKILLVGTHVSALPESAFKSTAVDFVARGEYEFTVINLAKNMKHLSKVRGISYRRVKKIIHNPDAKQIDDLEKIPWVSPIYKEFLDVNNYAYALAKKPMVQILSSRGCPNMCVFCQYPQVFSGRKFRKRGVQDFVNELEWIKNNMPEIKEIFIEDDTFTVDKQRVEKICDEILRRNLKIEWSVNVRVDLRYDLMKKMKRAGCRLLVVGYESGNDQILKNIKKRITTKMSKEFARDAKRAKLKVFGCFMLGLPGETKESMLDTFKFAKEVDADMVFFQHAVPFPGTEMYEWAKKKKYITVSTFDEWYDKNGYFDFIMNYPELSSKEIHNTRDKFMKKYYMRPKFILKTILKSLKSPAEFRRTFRSGMAYLKFIITKR